jgi:hypothetical protein
MADASSAKSVLPPVILRISVSVSAPRLSCVLRGAEFAGEH